MSNTKQIIDALLNEDLFTVKKLVNEELFSRMGTSLEEKLIDFGPTLFETKELVGNQARLDKNKNGRLDREDFQLLGKENRKKKVEEDFNTDEEVLAEQFEEELKSLVEEIQEETGEELTEEEIIELAHELLDILSEESDEEDKEDDEEDAEESEVTEKPRTSNNVRLGTNAEY